MPANVDLAAGGGKACELRRSGADEMGAGGGHAWGGRRFLLSESKPAEALDGASGDAMALGECDG